MKTYKEYKDSGVEWIGKIPKEWKVKKIKYGFDVICGATPKSTNADYWDGDICWITPADYSSETKYIVSSARQITKLGVESCGTELVPKGSIIISNRAPIGSVALAGINLCTNQGCKALVRKQEEYLPEFYYYYLLVNNKVLNSLGRGTTFLELSTEDLKNFFLPMPSMDTQEKLTPFLNVESVKINALITSKENQNTKLKEYRQSLITEAVTKGFNPKVAMKDSGIEWIGKIPNNWALKKIKYVAYGYNGDRGIDYPSGDDFVDEGKPFITTYELNDGKISLSKVQYITEAKYNKLGGLKIKKGDIIYCLRGSVGKTGLSDFDNGTIASSLMGIRCRDSVLPKFLNYLLNSKIEEQERKYLTTGSVSANLAAENVMQFEFAFPDLHVQKEIIKFLDAKTSKIDSIITKNNDIIAKLKEYRQSLIFEVVTGKRKVC